MDLTMKHTHLVVGHLHLLLHEFVLWLRQAALQDRLQLNHHLSHQDGRVCVRVPDGGYGVVMPSAGRDTALRPPPPVSGRAWAAAP